jgi:hypothetical protein
MSVMLTWLADDLRAEGCEVVEIDGWKTYGRPGAFDPDGPCWHHTGTTTSSSKTAPTLDTCINGRSDLEGPLCQGLIGYDGVIYVIAAGRANHAGACSGFGPYTSARDGNDQLVGFEIDYDGTQQMSAAQKTAATKASAVVLRRLKHDHTWAVRHEETSTTGKWDTGGLTGGEIRSLVKDYMDNSGGGLFGMSTVSTYSNSNSQKFRGDGTYKTVEIDDAGGLTLVVGPKDPYLVMAGLTIEASGEADSIAPGDWVQVRYQAVIDYPDSKPTIIDAGYPVHEVQITGGASFANLEWTNTLGGESGGGTKKLRLFINPPTGKSLKVTKVAARVLT